MAWSEERLLLLPRLKRKSGFPIFASTGERPVPHWAGQLPSRSHSRVRKRPGCLKPLDLKGFLEMSRMTLLRDAVWLGQNAGDGRAAGNVRPDGYPPFNIELLAKGENDADAFRITLAVAGFKREDLDVTVADGALIIQGSQSEDGHATPREYLHRGIAARQFKRSFGLADGVEVCKAELQNGLLTIELRRVRKVQPVRKVGIVSGG